MDVPALASFDSSDWKAIFTAFQNAPSLPLGQAWREKPEENFRPASVHLGWNADGLLVLARLTDDTLFTRATADNENLWTLGDVFELFLQESTLENYVEFHIAPSGHRLQLGFPSGDTIGQLRTSGKKLDDLKVARPLFDFSLRSTDSGWDILAKIPASALGMTQPMGDGTTILASFSRYDYTDAATPPVLSSTSAHAELNFHRRQEWKPLTLHSTLG